MHTRETDWKGWAMAGAELSEVIAKLRNELAKAMSAGERARLRFELGPIEVTLLVTVTSEGAGKAGVRFWVVEGGVDGRRSRAAEQQIKLTLNPVDALVPRKPDGSPAKVSLYGPGRPRNAAADL